MSESYEVREARREDAVALSAFLAGVIAERLPVIYRRDRAMNAEESLAFIEELTSSPRSVLFVADSEGAIVGMLDFRGEQKPQRAHAGGFGMSVDRRWRRMGIGKSLLDALLVWAHRNEVRRIELEVLANNPGAIALYEKAGFVLEGAKAKAVEVDGEYVDLLQMAKLL